MSGALIAPMFGLVQAQRAVLTDERVERLDMLDEVSRYDRAAVPLIGFSTTSSGMSSDLSRGLQSTVAMSAAGGIWQTIIDITGAGFLRGAAIFGGAVASGQALGLRITIDGVVYSRMQVASGNSTPVLVTTGAMMGVVFDQSAPTPMYLPQSTLRHRFDASLKIEAVRGLTGILATVGYTYSLDR